MSMDNDTTRDRVRSAALIGVKQPAAQPDRQALQATGAHPAPCARHCEAQAFRIEMRRLHAENEVLRQGYDAARLEIASLKTDHMQALTAYQTTVDNLTAQMEAVGAGGMEPLRKRCLHQISEPAQPVGAAPVGIVAASPGYVGVGWIGGYVPKHNDKLYAAPQPAAQALDARWVSAKDRLPDPFCEVLIHPRPTDYCCEGSVNTQGEWSYGEYEHHFGHNSIKCNVTHWMPLPTPPVAIAAKQGVK